MTRTERQEMGIKLWIENSCKGCLLFPTGFGKTFTAIKAIIRFLNKNPNKKILVIVPTDYLKTQWIEKLLEHKLFPIVDVQIINSAVKCNQRVDLLILDEIHVFAATTFFQVFNKIKYQIILGLTGTLDRLDGKESLIKEYCPIVDTVTMEEALANKWISEYVEYKVLLDVDLTEYNEVNAEFLQHFATFNYDFSIAMKCVTDFKARYDYAKSLCQLSPSAYNYKDTVSNLNKQVAAAAFSWMRALKWRKNFVMSHPKKFDITREILNARPNTKAITFSATIADAESIGIGYVLHSGKTKKKRGIIMDEFNELEIGVLNSSKALDVGEIKL